MPPRGVGQPVRAGTLAEPCFGERLRRARRRREAREQLRSAAATFERLAAEPWAARAATELRATGETVRRRDRTADEELTPQELQIALHAAEGELEPRDGRRRASRPVKPHPGPAVDRRRSRACPSHDERG